MEYRYTPSVQDVAACGAAQSVLHERARDAVRANFGRKVFVRAVVEVSNYCRENCGYCGMRRDNRNLARYRARVEELAEVLVHHRPASVTDINIQTGEDPVAIREIVVPLIEVLRRETSLGISVCVGTLAPDLYTSLRSAGAEVYIMKFECADPVRYARLEAPGTLAERLDHIRLLAREGWTVSSGFIAGLPGQSPEDLLTALEFANDLPIDGCSVSPFIPGNETPLAGEASSNPDWTLNCMASLRLMRPHWVIPAVSALNLAEHEGYRRGLRAGANLVTINLTPSGLRDDYVIYKRDRVIMTEERILRAMAEENLTPSPTSLIGFYRGDALLERSSGAK